MKKLTNIKTADEARAYTQAWQQWASTQSLSYGELLDWHYYFAGIVGKFPELAEEFNENGII